jgi:hypothetical protein
MLRCVDCRPRDAVLTLPNGEPWALVHEASFIFEGMSLCETHLLERMYLLGGWPYVADESDETQEKDT